MKIKHFSFLIIFILSLLFTPYAAEIFMQIYGKQSSGFWGPSNPEYFWGFLMNLLLFGSFFSWHFYYKSKVLLYYIFPVFIFFLFLQSWKDLIIGLGLVIVGITLAQLFLSIKKHVLKIKSGELPDVSNAPLSSESKENYLGKIRLILIIFLSLEFFTGLLIELSAGGSLPYVLVKLLSIIFLIIALYYVIKNNSKCYLYIGIYAALRIIIQFFGMFNYAALAVYGILVIFSLYKLSSNKKILSIKNSSNFDRFIINTVFFILVLSLLLKFPVFILAVLSFIELFGDVFVNGF